MSERYVSAENEQNPSERLRVLPEQLGYIETEQLRQLRQQMTEDFKESIELGIQTKILYQVAAEDLINHLPSAEFTRAQLALTISYALVKYDAGLIDSYADELYDAADYAYGLGLDDIYNLLESARAEQ